MQLIKDKLHVTYMNGFGFAVAPETFAKVVGNAFGYSGGINPVTLLTGTDDQVIADVRKYVDVLGPYGSYMVCDGYNVASGTKVERLNGIVKLLDDIGLNFKK